jgi:ferritin-like metal-binding protein YciE
MSVETIQDLFVNELKDLYSAEKQITKALPKLAKAAASPELRDAFTTHLRETETHVQRLEQVFDIIGAKGRGKTCEGMKGLLTEGNELLAEADKGEVRDAGMIPAAQRVEHYEMAAYGSVREMAALMGHDDVAELLEATLEEEKAADKKLTMIAKKVNQAALTASGEQDTEEDVDAA